MASDNDESMEEELEDEEIFDDELESEPRNEGKKLAGHLPLNIASSYGFGALLFSIPFLGVGIAAMLASLGILKLDKAPTGDSAMGMFAFGYLFAYVGAIVFVRGFIGFFARLRDSKRKAQHQFEPWYWEYPWSANGVSDKAGWKVINGFIGSVLSIIFVAPFNYILWSVEGGGFFWIAYIFLALFDVLAGVVVFSFFHTLLAYLRYGSNRLRFSEFPIRLGKKIVVTLEGNRLTGFEKFEATLRYIYERIEVTGSGDDRSTNHFCYALHEEKKTLSQAELGFGMQGMPGGMSNGIRLEFQLPDDKTLTNEIRSEPPRYWQLQVHGYKSGPDYSATFLLPIYAQ